MLGRAHALDGLRAPEVGELALFEASPKVIPEGVPAWVTPGVVTKAIRFLTQKRLMTPRQFEALIEQYKAAGFSIAGITRDAMLETARDTIRDGVREGWSPPQTADAMQEALDARGFSRLRPWHARLVAHMNAASAYGTGQYQALTDERTAALIPAWRYVTMDDDRVRPTHAAMQGKVFAREDPVWDGWFPPNGYNCRCHVVGVPASEWDGQSSDWPTVPRNEALPDGARELVQPDDGFDGNPGTYVREQAGARAWSRTQQATRAALTLPDGYAPPPGYRVLAVFQHPPEESLP